MNTVFRPLLRSAVLRNNNTPFMMLQRPIPLVHRLHRPTAPLRIVGPFLSRGVASSVSRKPGSQDLEHAATNIKEEVGNSAADLAKAIAGSNMTKDSVDPTGTASFLGITKNILAEVPTPMLVLGLAGGLPYVAASVTTVYLAYEAGIATSGVVTTIDPGVALTVLDKALTFQVTYGAVMLSFLGAMHWGMETAAYGGQKGYTRLALGAAPVLVAWSTLAMQPIGALIVQWLGYTGLWFADSKATIAGWTPKWYSQYRFYLSLLVGTCIIGSLAGTSYWGPVAGHGLLSHDLDLIREERKKMMPARSGVIPGLIEAVPAGAQSDHFVRIHNKKADREKDESK
ncbi:hypothetical protein AMATHDRAFT_141874 [Amanita thiersii Skay4041]|uniref:Mnn4-regulates the mannosylphosphorylation n=1 Tax=Amanita thiersii Skay4041 TaxID=703135 RepID=A0A2A9NL28_9AGAR|nr:hypothetical protein AMATHDRAFT_141874 [Amanita thiersii Skay4041]